MLSSLFSQTVADNTKVDAEADFRRQYKEAKANQERQQQEAMAVDGAATTRKADHLAETEAKRQRQSEDEAAASAAS